LTLTNVNPFNNGIYQVIISDGHGSITSSEATFVVEQPSIVSTTNTAPGTIWINGATTLLVGDNPFGGSTNPLSYRWAINDTNIYGATGSNFLIYNITGIDDGNYTVTINNGVESTNETWEVRLALPGMVEAWGDDTYGECDRPVTLMNAMAIAAGEYQSIAVTDGGTVMQWGQYSDGTNEYPVTNTSVATQPPDSNIVAVAAGLGHALGLMNGGLVVAWGLTNDATANWVPMNLSNVTAVAAGWHHNVALSNGTVIAWGDNTFGQTNVPSDLTNATAIAAGEFHSLALRADGKVEAWGCNTNGQTNVPSGLSNVVAIAAGGQCSVALKSDGTVVPWGYGQTNLPSGMSNVMAIAAGNAHSLALINDGTLVAWGDNSEGQTNLPSGSTNVDVKLIAAGGNHSMAAIFSSLVQYPVDPSKDLLLIYNTNSTDSSNVCQYYLTHRPMVSNAMVLGIGVTTNDPILFLDYSNIFRPQIQMWLSNNPTTRPLYVILFQDVPQEIDDEFTNGEDQATGHDYPSVQYQLRYLTDPSWRPFVTAINMNGLGATNYFTDPGGSNYFNSSDGTNDCIAYVNKVIVMASNNPPGTLIISAAEEGYNNTNWYFDDSWHPGEFSALAIEGLSNVDASASFFINPFGVILAGTNVSGYLSAGWDGGHPSYYAITNSASGGVQFSGNSGWYIMTSADSFSGQRVTFQSSFLTWFASNAFGGTNYSNTPIGVTGTVNEPGVPTTNPEIYYGYWASGKSFAITAWAAMGSLYSQAVGDPFTKR
jgi:alpha-tubulin suppressor-like RCC1 family protein